MLFSLITNSQAELLELVIDLNVENKVITSGETITITGKVVDQAYKPIRGAEVLIRAGSDTTKAFTDPWGVFTGEIKDFQRIPGTYTVNVIASWYGMIGISSSQFEVKGDKSPVLVLQEKLSTDEARKYLSSNKSDFDKNPIGQTLFKYYHGLHDELIIELEEARKHSAEQIYIEQQREVAENLRNQDLKEYNPKARTFGGYQLEDYIRSLNPEIRDLVASQLNFTMNIFEEGQKLRDEILANGGTYEEARKAYLEKIAIPKESLEQFNQEKLVDESEEDLENNQTSEEEEDSENQE
jgi:hypothetical protein